MNRLRIVGLAMLAAAPAWCQFRVPDQCYRCPSAKDPAPSFETGGGFTVNYIEFRDDGSFYQPRQLEDALAQIDKAYEANRWALVIVYIHGWKNNDSPANTDVAKFKDTLLTQLGSEYSRGGSRETPPVVGIFIGWRGLTFTIEPFRTFSYWPRRTVARRLGQKGVYDAMGSIVNRVSKHRQEEWLLFAGHSFGSRVLENAADSVEEGRAGFMEADRRVRFRKGGLSAPNRPLAPADLILYINAATSSAVSRRVIKELKTDCAGQTVDPICRGKPLYFAVTSWADIATGIIMPVANLVFPALKSDGLHLISAANTPWLHTDRLPDKIACAGLPSPAPKECAPNDGVDFCFETAAQKCYEVRRVHPDKPAPPFWVMNVGPSVMASHGDIWNESVLNMVTSVVRENPHLRNLKLTFVLSKK